MKRIRIAIAAASAPALAACAVNGEKPKSASSPPPGLNKGYAHDPYPSTYRAYPGVATVVRNVTIFDGEGGRIDNGQILFADGKIVGVG